MSKINILPFSVANLIAAGEVVDRPASVVKELMENAIDAGATSITVEIQHGGVTFLRVSDNGCGMEPEDLPVAVCRHATSKIKDAADLDGILTLGFRGEALAAIAAVSQMRIVSRTADADYGAMLEVDGGEIVSLTEQGCSVGTSVIVENLFYNVPARRKFLKRDATEALAVGANVEKVALSHPEIAVRLISDGATKLRTAGDGKLESAVYAVFGKEFASRMIYVTGGDENIHVSGCIGRSDNVKANRNYQNYFLNGRYVRSKTACAAVEQAYVSFLPPEKFPCCVLYITLNPSAVDVNVHPAKLEVKFSNEKPVFEAIYYTVRAALEENRARPEIRLPEKKEERIPERMTAKEYTSMVSKTGTRVSDAFVPIRDRVAGEKESEQMRIGALPRQENMAGNPSVPSPQPVAKTPDVQERPTVHETAPPPSIAVQEIPIPPPSKPQEEQEKVPEGPVTVEEAVTSMPPIADMPVLPEYRIIGEAFHSYVLVEKGIAPDAVLLLVDKHAAHERIIFERLKAGLYHRLQNEEQSSQLLMLPVEFMLTSSEIQILNSYRKEIEEIGFSFETGVHTVSVSAVPEGIDAAAAEDMLAVIASRIGDETGNALLTRDILFEKALYQASCKAAIKAGREYADAHIEWIIGKLMELPDITVCPHGRPVAMELSKKKIDRQFQRT